MSAVCNVETNYAALTEVEVIHIIIVEVEQLKCYNHHNNNNYYYYYYYYYYYNYYYYYYNNNNYYYYYY